MGTQQTIRRIERLDDPMLGPWLDLYQESFPLAEQMRVSDFIRALQSGFVHEYGNARMLVLERPDFDGPAGIAWQQFTLSGRALWLYYLAVSPSLRGQGTGAWFYKALIDLARAERPGLELLVFEVERPDLLEGSERTSAERRIAFYRRLGARLVNNVVYYQDVGWQPPVQMYLMAHTLVPIHEDKLAGMLRDIFGHGAEPFDHIELE